MRSTLPARRTLLSYALLAGCVAAPLAVSAQQPAPKRPLTYAAWSEWRSIQGPRLSPGGDWVLYTLGRQEGDGELVLRSTRDDREHRYARATSAQFSPDGRAVLFLVPPDKEELEKAQKEKKKPEDQPKSALGIVSLADGKLTRIERVKSFRLPAKKGDLAAYHLETPPSSAAAPAPAKESKEGGAAAPEAKKKTLGTELVLRHLGTGAETRLPEVADFLWNEDGSWLVYTVASAADANDGLFARKIERDGVSAPRPVLTGTQSVKQWAWNEEGAQLAFLGDRDDQKSKTPAFKLYTWKAGNGTAAEVVSAGTPGFPAKHRLADTANVSFSRDGDRLYFGVAPDTPEPAKKGEPVNVDIWHWQDEYLQPMQKIQANGARRRSFLATWDLRNRKLTPLASDELPSVSIPPAGRYALGESDVPYRAQISWDGRYSDVYLVDQQDGSREKVLTRSRSGASLSPEGKFVLYFSDEDGAWHARRVKDGKTVNLTGKLPVKFVDETWDTPDMPRPYGVAGWTGDDRRVLIYDRYDLWEANPETGETRCVTAGEGRARQTVFRYVRLDPEQRTVPEDQPLLLSAADERTRATGYYRVSLAAGSSPTRVVMLDKEFGSLSKAKDGETLLFSLQRFDEYPDLWVSDGSFSGMRKLTDANPQQAKYVWGRSELIEYRSTDGKPLRGILTRPENWQPGQRLPLMVYIYETRSEGLHRYVAPAPGTSINIARYVSSGYLVLQPDIVYDTGYPGESALKCVLPAVQRVIEMGLADPERVGIQGHSWGAYQINYLITRTHLFRAAQAGASVANMISAYGGIRWGSGMSRAFQYEKTQSRIGGPPWERPLQFIENSPIFWVDKVTTPYLTIHNDADGAVPWYQGIEFFTALRRLGKEAYLFNYNGEDHGLRTRANQKHWTVHQDEFFDHHLLGKPRPDWMERGVPYLERGTRDLTDVFKAGKE
ncbi:MAG: prolyl oligopeptidase family serine peptidase [Armatimonadota bacterium]